MTKQITSGFTLIETAATLTVVALLAAGLISVSTYLLNRQQIDSTNEQIYMLRRAISGNPVIVVNEARTSFGYLGDMGKLPDSLQDLWIRGSQPDYVFNTAKKVGAGWNGPYLDIGANEFAASLLQDGWGGTLSWDRTTTYEQVFATTSLALLSSLGPDFSLGSTDDIRLRFFKADVYSRVQGYVKDTNGDTVSGVGLTLNRPVNGSIPTGPPNELTVYTDSTGYYSAPDVPYGNRSITIKPMLVLAPGTIVVSGGSSQHLKFTVKNYGSDDVWISSLTLKYSISPASKFSQVIIGNTTVYNDTTPRFGSADPQDLPNGIIGSTTPLTVGSKKKVKGTGLNEESIPIRLQSPVTDVADLVIGKVGKGGSIVIEFRNFYNEVDSEDIDALGVNFEVTFSGSIELDTAPTVEIGKVAVTP